MRIVLSNGKLCELTFDVAQERFREQPIKLTASDYLFQTIVYWTDEMISDETMLAATREVAEWLGKS